MNLFRTRKAGVIKHACTYIFIASAVIMLSPSRERASENRRERGGQYFIHQRYIVGDSAPRRNGVQVLQNSMQTTTVLIVSPSKIHGFGPWRRNISEQLYNLAKEPFDVIPKTFLPAYKSPCFLVNPVVPTSIRCLPYFYLIGVQKSGTTDVWNRIISHPSIVRTTKEQHYWARNRVVKNISIHTYLNRQSKKLVNTFVEVESSHTELITGDGSTSAIGDNRWQNMTSDPYDGPQYLAAHIMRELQPHSKHIIVLRDPVTRTYSDFLFFGVSSGKFGLRKSAELFHLVVQDDIQAFQNCTAIRSQRACTYILGEEGTRTLFGYYAVYVRDWLKLFPRNQLYILRIDDWQRNCVMYLREIYAFLDIRSLPQSKLEAICQQEKKFVNKKKDIYGPMLAETEVLLRDFFRGKNRELSDLLSDTRYLWKYPNDTDHE